MDVRAWKWHEAALVEEVEDGEAEQGRDDANVTSPVETVAQLDASVPVLLVSRSEGLKYPELDP